MRDKRLNVIHLITGLNDGGAEGTLYRLCVHDKKNEHLVISLMGEGKYGPLLKSAGVKLHCLNMPQGRITLKGIWKLWRLLRTHSPDVLQTWLYHADLVGGVVAKMANVGKVFWGIRNGNLKRGTVKKGTIVVARLCGYISSWVPFRIISCSEKAIQTHLQFGYTADKFRVIPNGYDLSQFVRDKSLSLSMRTELNIAPSVPLLGMVARFDPQKDHANLIAALSLLKKQKQNFHCILVGTGMEPNNNELTNLITAADLTDRITLLGRRNDIPALMCTLDIHVLSSLGEAFPNVLAEAMACSTPCVTTDVGDAALIVGNTGWVVPREDASALADAIKASLTCLEDELVWPARQNAARERISMNFTIEHMAKTYDAMWREGLTH